MKKIIIIISAFFISYYCHAQNKELSGFWGVSFYQSADTAMGLIKLNHNYKTSNISKDGEDEILEYRDVFLGDDLCNYAKLYFYENKLCAGYFTILSEDEGVYKAKISRIVSAIKDKYGAYTMGSEDGAFWDFKEKGFILVSMHSGHLTIIYHDGIIYDQLIKKSQTASSLSDY